ncbi:MAG TPA: hypothetical protein VNX15_11745, partial [Gemmatimonadales bacterium]|nr:hypothetical protein [Gemmatimonadales bacterium]
MTFLRRIATLLTTAFALAAAASCSKGGTTPTQIRTLSKVAGDSQVGSAGVALGTSLSVQVKDQNGAPVSGAVVSWGAGTGGGSVGAPSSSTDGTGTATMSRTLGPAAGYQSTTASLSGATGSPITFTSISQVQGAFTIAAGTGTGQTDTVLATLGAPFQVLVTDHTGAPVAGVIVGFAVTSGGGSMTQSADTTDGSGHATAALIFPSTVGTKSVQASVTGLLGSPVGFSALATAGHAAAMSLGTGNAQAA